MRLLSAAIVLLLATVSSPARAFELSGPTWPDGQATFFVNIPGIAPSGDSWNAAFNRALNAWTTATDFTFSATSEYRDPCAGQNSPQLGDRVTGVDFAPTQCGSAFGQNVLALTLESFVCANNDCNASKEYVETDIVFNEAVNWDIYSGPHRDDTEDFERVALHELGHALGLNHEFFADAIMAPFVSDINSLQQDDINGANFLYGTSTASPSIYGIAIEKPNVSVFTAASASQQYFGSLNSTDSVFEGKFLDILQLTFANDTETTLSLESDAFDTSLILARVDSTQQLFPDQLYSDDNSGSNSNARLVENLSAGTYWVGITSSATAEQGDYTLQVESFAVNSNTPLESFTSIYGIDVEINPNPVIFNSLEVSDGQFDNKFVDIYQLQVNSPIELNIDVESAQFDTRMFLAQIFENQQFGGLFIEDDDNGAGTNSRIQAEMDPGTYWIAVTSFANNATGDYQITMSVVID